MAGLTSSPPPHPPLAPLLDGGGYAEGGPFPFPKEASMDAMMRRPAVTLSHYLMPFLKAVSANHILKQRLSRPGPKFNNGYDDQDGHYIAFPGEELMGRFMVQQVLGKGSFGTVVKAFDLKNREHVAVKISRSGSYFISQSVIEVDILKAVNRNPRLQDLVVRLRKYFMWQGHAVLVFQLLSFNLYQLVKLSKYNGVSLDLTRKFAFQLLHVLLELESNNPPIIHCDMKPENILLFDQNRSRIRVIDFGSACVDSPEQHKHKYIQSRFYRSPEVMLGLPYSTPVDRWSLGCILLEMHTGTPILPGRSEAEQLARMEALLGPLPHSMILQGAKSRQYYTGLDEERPQLIKGPLPNYPTSLNDVVGVYSGGPRGSRLDTPGHDPTSYEEFVSFIRGLLTYDPAKRMSCTQALRHPFIAPAASPPSLASPATATGFPDSKRSK